MISELLRSRKSMLLAAFAAVTFLTSCGDSDFWDSSCRSEREEIESRFGPPEDVDTYRSSRYSEETWWYWSRGFAYTFTYYNYCEVSISTFSPR